MSAQELDLRALQSQLDRIEERQLRQIGRFNLVIGIGVFLVASQIAAWLFAAIAPFSSS